MDPEARTALRPRLLDIAEPVVARYACELVAIELTNEHGMEIVRLFIDAPGGVTVGDCTKVSRALSAIFDVDDPMPEEKYRLEVSSPGSDRPVQRRQDLLRFQGFKVRVRLTPREGRRRFTGTLAGLEGDELLLDCDGTPRRIPLAELDKARLVLTPDEFDRLGREGLPPVPDEPASPPPSTGPSSDDA